MPDELLPGQPREKNWWLNHSAERRGILAQMDESLEEKVLSKEYSTFNPDETRSWNESLNFSNDPFPVALNPSYDLNAMIMVSEVKPIITYDQCMLVWLCIAWGFL